MVEATTNSSQNILLKEIKSNFVLRKIFGNLKENSLLAIIKYNKKIQNKLNKNLDDYKNYRKTIIEIIPEENKYGNFINKLGKEIHIYFNDEKKEIDRNYLKKGDNIKKIKILIDENIKSFEGLFKSCECIKMVNFIRFNRKDIINMSEMFRKCTSLRELNHFNCNNNILTGMYSMFSGCTSLKKLNMEDLNVNSVTDMSYMFNECISIEEININNFCANSITDMSYMFYNCKSLKKLNLPSIKLNTNSEIDMTCLLDRCSSLKELNCSDKQIKKWLDYSKQSYKYF